MNCAVVIGCSYCMKGRILAGSSSNRKTGLWEIGIDPIAGRKSLPEGVPAAGLRRPWSHRQRQYPAILL